MFRSKSFFTDIAGYSRTGEVILGSRQEVLTFTGREITAALYSRLPKYHAVA